MAREPERRTDFTPADNHSVRAMPSRLVRAAGGVVWRKGVDGELEVCLVHRPWYDDWTLPKGKLQPGEHALAAAVREVSEETGVSATPQLPLRRVRYRVDDAPKIVEYWSMAAQQVSQFRPSSEVDSLTWLSGAAAMRRLSYRNDVALIRLWQELPQVTSMVLLVRHALAGRASSPAIDQARTLTASGALAAQRLCRLLELFLPQQLVSASPQRCIQTLQPLATATDLAITVRPEFDAATADPAISADSLRELAATHRCAIVCSQREVIAPALAALTADESLHRTATSKGDGWVLPFAGSHPLPPARLGVTDHDTA